MLCNETEIDGFGMKCCVSMQSCDV